MNAEVIFLVGTDGVIMYAVLFFLLGIAIFIPWYVIFKTEPEDGDEESFEEDINEKEWLKSYKAYLQSPLVRERIEKLEGCRECVTEEQRES